MKMIITEWDEAGNEIITECEAFTEAYPGQIEEIIAGIEAGLSTREALSVYANAIPALSKDAGT